MNYRLLLAAALTASFLVGCSDEKSASSLADDQAAAAVAPTDLSAVQTTATVVGGTITLPTGVTPATAKLYIQDSAGNFQEVNGLQILPASTPAPAASAPNGGPKSGASTEGCEAGADCSGKQMI